MLGLQKKKKKDHVCFFVSRAYTDQSSSSIEQKCVFLVMAHCCGCTTHGGITQEHKLTYVYAQWILPCSYLLFSSFRCTSEAKQHGVQHSMKYDRILLSNEVLEQEVGQ